MGSASFSDGRPPDGVGSARAPTGDVPPEEASFRWIKRPEDGHAHAPTSASAQLHVQKHMQLRERMQVLMHDAHVLLCAPGHAPANILAWAPVHAVMHAREVVGGVSV